MRQNPLSFRAVMAGLLVLSLGFMQPNAIPLSYASGVPAALDVWWPTDNAVISGTQPFKVMLQDHVVQEYEAYWQVDGDRLNPMTTSMEGYPHKETSVDLSGWTWRGRGPYTVTFVAKDGAGTVLAMRSVRIENGTAAAASSSQASSSSSVPTLARLRFLRGSRIVFAGARLYVNPQNDASRQAEAWKTSRPQDAQTILKIAGQPESFWMGNWNPDIAGDAQKFADQALHAGALPVFVLYNIPRRDCGGYSAGGANGGDAYRAWVRGFAEGVGNRAAAVILEPDALAGMDCLSTQDQETRMALLREAVRTLQAQPRIAVYMDAGHAAWKGADVMAERLKKAGIDGAAGFSLNVSNFETDADSIRYGSELSQKTGGKHFVYDAGRNGNGPAPDRQWCNPAGRALGRQPTSDTGNALVDAILWVKGPGSSDGSCNGAPPAGQWFPEYALGLAQRAAW
ncbi:MAG: glycoside hydrolase family 6 protein [Patescibacteria group bacterium]